MNFKIVDQRYDGFEAWVRVGEVNLRLDFILEFYLSGDLHISRENHCKYGDKECIEKFAISFLNKYEHAYRFSCHCLLLQLMVSGMYPDKQINLYLANNKQAEFNP